VNDRCLAVPTDWRNDAVEEPWHAGEIRSVACWHRDSATIGAVEADGMDQLKGTVLQVNVVDLEIIRACESFVAHW